jgi:acetyl-CoA carboxylase alpha subunit
MNKRIEQLAKQASRHAQDKREQYESIHDKDQNRDEYEDVYNTKFARLIVQECIDALRDHGVDYVEETLNDYFDMGEEDYEDEEDDEDE